jgi:phage anti-repressor protein
VYHVSLVDDATLSIHNIMNNTNVMLGINHGAVPAEQQSMSDIQKQEIDDILGSWFTTQTGHVDVQSFVVDAGLAATWLTMTKGNFIRALRRSNFKEGRDYHETLEGVAAHETRPRRRPIHNVMMTTECFKGVCMMITTPKSKEVMEYFITAEETLRCRKKGKDDSL